MTYDGWFLCAFNHFYLIPIRVSVMLIAWMSLYVREQVIDDIPNKWYQKERLAYRVDNLRNLAYVHLIMQLIYKTSLHIEPTHPFSTYRQSNSYVDVCILPI